MNHDMFIHLLASTDTVLFEQHSLLFWLRTHYKIHQPILLTSRNVVTHLLNKCQADCFQIIARIFSFILCYTLIVITFTSPQPFADGGESQAWHYYQIQTTCTKNIPMYYSIHYTAKSVPVTNASSCVSSSAGCDIFHLVFGKLSWSPIDLIRTIDISDLLYLQTTKRQSANSLRLKTT